MTIEELIEQKEKEYFEIFGSYYFVDFSENLTNADIISEIDDCLRNNKPKEIPKYTDDVLY